MVLLGIMISIYFNPRDVRRWFQALNRLERRVLSERMKMQRRCALGYKRKLTEKLLRGGYAVEYSYARYSKRYSDWKYRTLRRNGYAAGSYWSLTKTLVNSLQIFRIGDDGYHAGIIPGARAPGTSWFGERIGEGAPKSVDMYARVNEFGSRSMKVPARPVFYPAAFDYANEEWEDEGRSTLRRIGNAWR